MGCFHLVGAFLLFAASILLVITTITAPVVGNLSILNVHGQSSSINYGTFGYCVTPQGNQYCSDVTVGYDAVGALQSVVITQFGSNQRDSINMLTKAMILHPIAAGIAFFAFLISAASGSLGSVLGGVIAFITWLVALAVMAIDLAMFGQIRTLVNSHGGGVYADYSAGMWTCVAAVASLFVGSIVVLCTCCSSRHVRHRHRHKRRWYY